jgi:hypothetical protein
MKHILLTATLFMSGAGLFAQTAFWTENFGQGCNQGQAATAYSSANGSWTETATGTNDPYADGWFVSATASGTGTQNCSDNCSQSSVTDRTLHIGNAAVPLVGIGADTGSTYLTGVFCPGGICSVTNKRIESPTINTVNRFDIGISFLYYEGGELGGDEATLWYSPDAGVTWQQVDQLAKISASCAGTSGLWTEFSLLLPASASNNPGIKFAFQWTNDNDGTGSDPSFAVDDVVLLEDFPTSIAPLASANISLVTEGNAVTVNSGSNTWELVSVVDVTGREISTIINGNQVLFDEPSGIYFITVAVNGEHSVHKVMFTK